MLTFYWDGTPPPNDALELHIDLGDNVEIVRAVGAIDLLCQLNERAADDWQGQDVVLDLIATFARVMIELFFMRRGSRSEQGQGQNWN